MNYGLFKTFCEMLESIPIKAVVRAADAERKMVQDDLEKKRTEPDVYVNSVLAFCNFLGSAVRGIRSSVPIFPIEHCAFYREIVRRLVDAGELPQEIIPEFERIFCRQPKASTTGDGPSESAAPTNKPAHAFT